MKPFADVISLDLMSQVLWHLEVVRFMVILKCQPEAVLLEIDVLIAVKVLENSLKIRAAHSQRLVALSGTLSEMTEMFSRENRTGIEWRLGILDSFLQTY